MKKIIFLDTETTGNELAKDRLCQVCYKVDGEVKTEYFKPPIPISVKASSVTHITNKMVEDKECFIGSNFARQLQVDLNDGILVAHNAKFDISMLSSEKIDVNQFICTLRISRWLDQESVIPEYGLQFLRYFLDLDVEGKAHDAEGDVSVLEALFKRLLQKVIEKEGTEEKAINKMVEISSRPVLFEKFNFGKYKDKKVDYVLKNDRKYLEWMLGAKSENKENEEDWIYTLNHYLSIK